MVNFSRFQRNASVIHTFSPSVQYLSMIQYNPPNLLWFPIVKTDNYQIWIKDLEDGGKAVGIFNLSDTYQTITLNRNENGLKGYTKIRDVWQQKYLIVSGSDFTVKVAPHGVVLLKMASTESLKVNL